MGYPGSNPGQTMLRKIQKTFFNRVLPESWVHTLHKKENWDLCEFLPNNDCESGCQHTLLELLALEHSIAGDALSEIIFSEVVGAAIHRAVSAVF